MRIVGVEHGSIAEDLGILPGDELLEINSRRLRDILDYRFHEGDAELTLTVARNGEATLFEIEKDEDDQIGLTFEEMKLLCCGNNCIFCFVDQNPEGLRSQLYFRDGDYRLSFMYGNYTTLTNAGPAVLQRIADQRLSPQYISVHATDAGVRRMLMGLRKDDQILQKIGFLRDHGIAMHTQIVLCPGYNDGEVLKKTVFDLYGFNEQVVSVAVVPVGLTDHRFGLQELRRVDRQGAEVILDQIETWQKQFRGETGRGFVYASDEFYIVAGRAIPPGETYDGFPQIENGVGFVRDFLDTFREQSARFPSSLRTLRTVTLVTGVLARGLIEETVTPVLRKVRNLNVRVVCAPNLLFGSTVTVSGLLSANCVYSALIGKECGDLVLLPPDILNADGVFLDNVTIAELEQRIATPAMVFGGEWGDVFKRLRAGRPNA